MPSIAGSHGVISRPFLLYPLTTGYYLLYLVSAGVNMQRRLYKHFGSTLSFSLAQPPPAAEEAGRLIREGAFVTNSLVSKLHNYNRRNSKKCPSSRARNINEFRQMSQVEKVREVVRAQICVFLQSQRWRWQIFVCVCRRCSHVTEVGGPYVL